MARCANGSWSGQTACPPGERRGGILVAFPSAMTRRLPLPLVELPAVYAVIGEHRHDPTWLLVLGSDGQPYAYRVLDGSVQPIIPDAAWRLDAGPLPLLDQIAG
jgi:hypothetical protein